MLASEDLAVKIKRMAAEDVNVTYRRLSVSTFIASNNLNVVNLPDSDRRFAVFGNGRQAIFTERAEFIAWMDDPANIGALWRYLRAMPAVFDPQIFDPYMAPKTHCAAWSSRLTRANPSSPGRILLSGPVR